MAKELNEDPADKRDLEELESALEDAEGDESEERPEPRQARREEPEEEEDPEAYLEEEERRPPRRERRNARFDDLQRERDAERDQRIRLEAQLAQLQRPAQGPATDPVAEAISEMGELQKIEMRLATFASQRGEQLTEEERADLLDQKLRIDMRKAELGARVYQARNQPAQVDPGLAYLKARYSDVTNDRLGVAEATRYYERELRKGRPDTLDLVEEAYQAARAELRGEPPPRRQNARPRPSDESRSRYSSTPSRGASTAAAPSATSVTISKEEAALAKELYKYEKDPQKRLQKYVVDVKRPAEAEERRGSRRT